MPLNALTALYLPTTWPPPANAGQLLLFFEKLLYYRPAEKLPTPIHLEGMGELLHDYIPAPFGNELDRFSRLLRDMQANAAEYYQAYFSITGRGKEEAAEAGWRQMASRLRQMEPKHESGQDELWRARLYLALAEIYQAGEQEISRGLAAISGREAAMFRELHGDEDDHLEGLPLRALKSSIMAPSLDRSSQLLEAWGMLYLVDGSPDRPWLLATADQEGAMLLCERYESAAGRAPEKILSLPLPPVASGAGYLARRDSWRAATQEMLAGISDLLEEAAFTKTVSSAGGQAEAGGRGKSAPPLISRTWTEDIQNRWKESLAAQEPQDASLDPAAPVLSFFRLPGIPFPRLFSLICRQREERPQTAPSSPHAILGVLSPSDAGSS